MVHFFKHTTESYSYIIPRHRILGDLKGKEKDEGIQQIIATSSLKVSGVKISWHVVGRTSE